MIKAIARYRILFLLALFVLLPATVFAAAAALDTWFAAHNNIDKFQVDLYEVDESNLPQVTYKYAVTDVYDGSGSGDPALDKWILGTELCTNKIRQPVGNTYTTPIDPAVCGAGGYNCVSTSYTVVRGNDADSGLQGIRFEAPAADLSFGQTHLFEITFAGETGRGDVGVGVKADNLLMTGDIIGPLCQPAAVTMSGASAAGAGNATFAVVAAAVMVMGVLSAGILRKK